MLDRRWEQIVLPNEKNEEKWVERTGGKKKWTVEGVHEHWSVLGFEFPLRFVLRLRLCLSLCVALYIVSSSLERTCGRLIPIPPEYGWSKIFIPSGGLTIDKVAEDASNHMRPSRARRLVVPMSADVN